MTYESKYWIDKWLIFRETFSDEFSVRDNWGVPTNVVFEDWKCALSGVSTSIVKYSNTTNFKDVHTVKVIINSDGFHSTLNCFVWCLAAAEYYILYHTSWIFYYHDGVTSIVIVTGYVLELNTTYTIHIVRDGATVSMYINWLFAGSNSVASTNIKKWVVIGNRLVLDTPYKGTIELAEIYNYAWTAEQVANDYNNLTYKDVRDGLVLDVDSCLWVIEDKIWNAVINSGVTTKRDGLFYVQNYNWGSLLNLNSVVPIVSSYTKWTVVATVKPSILSWAQLIFYFGDSSYWRRMIFYISTANLVGIFIDGIQKWNVGVNNAFTIGKTTTIALVQDWISPTLYINGKVAIQSISWTDRTAWFSKMPSLSSIRIWSQAVPTETSFFNGNMSNVRLYSRALSSNEIMQLYTSSLNDYR